MSYEHLARAYDALSDDMPAAPWARYLLELAGHPKSILEYACGTGRITAELAKSGASVVALDAEERMLDEARRNLRRLGHPVRLVAADMTDFSLARPVPCAICACDGVNYLLEEKELRSFFSHALSNLEPGGVLLFDISSPHKLRDILANQFFYDDGDEQTLFWQNSFDPASQTCRMDLTLFIADGPGYVRFDEVHLQRAWEPSIIERALEDAGFEKVEAFRFGTLRPPSEEDERVQFRARKGA